MFDEWMIDKKLWWLLKPRLRRLANVVQPYAMISRNRMQNLYRLWRRVERSGVPGDFVESGVARGGSALLITLPLLQADRERQVWLYDAFELFDPPFATHAEVCGTFYETFGLDRERVHIVRGYLEESLPTRPDRPIALLHIDMSHYEGTKVSFEALGGRVSPGGWVVIDNYGRKPGCRRAVDEWLAAHQPDIQLQRFGETQAYFQVSAS